MPVPPGIILDKPEQGAPQGIVLDKPGGGVHPGIVVDPPAPTGAAPWIADMYGAKAGQPGEVAP